MLRSSFIASCQLECIKPLGDVGALGVHSLTFTKRCTKILRCITFFSCFNFLLFFRTKCLPGFVSSDRSSYSDDVLLYATLMNIMTLIYGQMMTDAD